MNKSYLFVFLLLFAWACKTNYPDIPHQYHTLLNSALVKAGDNAPELERALAESTKEQKEGMAFLISYMPKRDLTTLSADFLLENVDYAYQARAKYSWCAALPDSIFLNEVLPYANVSENRDEWRKDFYERFASYAENSDNMVEAIMSIAHNIKDEVDVEYNTKRSRVDISPLQAMKEHMATCTGLSILLTDAYRAVGIPSRLAGTAMWTNYKGNHTWSEVWIDGEWQFIEYYPDTLNQSWFVADAGKADPDNMLHWIYAASYKPTGMPYYAAVDAPYIMQAVDPNKLPEQMRSRVERMKDEEKLEPYIWGHNVTERYIDIYQESIKNSKLNEDELMANIVVFANEDTSVSESRLSCRVDVFEGDKTINFGYSPRKTDDMNQFLQLKLKKESNYRFVVSNPEKQINQEFELSTESTLTQDIQLILTN
ncbi:transglutaminase-like domain-containing protein [Draconibacterium sp. IB214405]|uniref:transglutaminase-like domain-containing protein n=1 Tax=Draconibacterium sp. IB214405 TaxID=3097352 RepID=UPI002A1133E1|nr:transglutaminase-like domain-containing protein [Draconibacterium sp. IB214405]MDX8337628.1 transglutaminase-like domain-containing protein [Draconibacterium sp. IB214405]